MTQHVALTFADGSLGVMQYLREPTDEAIQAEIDRSVFGQPVVSWRRISLDDLPKSRENRDAWRDDGRTIVVDPTRIKPPKPDPVKALEARIAKLESGSRESLK